jgi:hypothetical protein
MLLLVAAVTAGGCALAASKVDSPGAPPAIGELWEQPADLERRDLFHGPGGAALAPRETTFSFVARDRTGYSPGFDVKDSAGRPWSVKLGPEAQTEVTGSRILWAIGYHQPPQYYVPLWTLTATEAGEQPGGRFRPELEGHKVVDQWSWRDNPFSGTTPLAGLLVANLLINNWDWKASNNKIYAVSVDGGIDRRYVVRDIGASFGRTSYPGILKWLQLHGFAQGSRNDLDGFEQQGFIRRVRDDGRIDFDYQGVNHDLLGNLRAADVKWTCALIARITDSQWDDAFRAGGFAPGDRARYIRKIKEKVQQELNLTDPPAG